MKRLVMLLLLLGLMCPCIPNAASDRSPEYMEDEVVIQHIPSTTFDKTAMVAVSTKDSIETRKSNVLRYITTSIRDVDPGFVKTVVNEAFRIGHRYRFPMPEDILAVIWVESHFKPTSENNGSIGLMQVELVSWPECVKGKDMKGDIKANMHCGVLVLKDYYGKLNGDRRATLLAYNAGIGNYSIGRYDSSYFSKVDHMRTKLLSLKYGSIMHSHIGISKM